MGVCSIVAGAVGADYAHVYSPTLVNSNVHNLLHVYDNVFRFEDINTTSAYDYEAKLLDVGKLVHSGRNSLAQAVHRLIELERIEVAKECNPATAVECTTRMGKGKEIIATVRKGLMLRTNFRDQWYMTNDGTIVKYHTATQQGAQLIVEGHALKQKYSAFSQPCPSEHVLIFRGSVEDVNSGQTQRTLSSSILCKLAAVETAKEGEFIFVPLTHTFLTANKQTKNNYAESRLVD